MAQSYWLMVDEGLHLVVARFARMDESSFQAYLEELARRGPYDEAWRLVVIMPPQEQIDISTDRIRNAARGRQIFSDKSKRVIVASDDLSFGLGRVFGAEHPSDQYSVVKTIAEAEQVLGVKFSQLLGGTS